MTKKRALRTSFLPKILNLLLGRLCHRTIDSYVDCGRDDKISIINMDSSTTTISKRPPHVVNLDLGKVSLSKSRSAQEPLTPPATPLKSEDHGATGVQTSNQDKGTAKSDSNKDEILLFHGCLDLGDQLGQGSWSKVFAARENPIRNQHFLANSPPSPPASPAGAILATPCYAVKRPLHSMAFTVVKHEALILSKLTRSSLASSHIVGFHGFDASSSSLVLSRAPETLGNLAVRACQADKDNLSHGLASNPVIGLRLWLNISLQLIRGLDWIHSQGVIHGDIKASNILLDLAAGDELQASPELSPKALFCDFSSSRLITTGTSQPATILPTDAITTSYASPELLKAYSRSYAANPGSEPALPTEASDIWALAVTLVVAATGEDPYVHTGHEMRKLAMAKEGMVLEAASMGDRPLRVMRGSVVEKTVRGSLKKKVEARIGISDWIKEFEILMDEFGYDTRGGKLREK